MVHLGGHAVNGGKQLFEWGSLPHKRPCWIFTRPQDVIALAKNYELAGDAVEFICIVVIPQGRPPEAVPHGGAKCTYAQARFMMRSFTNCN